MTPAQALDQIIPGWQASLADKYSPAFIINLVSKHRASLEEMVAAVLGAERLKKGKRPRYDYDFAAYAALVPEERALDDQPDDVVVRRIQQRMTRMVERAVAKAEAEARAEARAQAEADALEMALTFIRMRAEAVLLREAGWDAVPLLRRYPSLVVMARDSTAAIRDWRGTVHLRAGFGALGPITVDTEKKVAAIEVTASGSRIDRYAMAFWARARALAGASITPLEPEAMPPDLRGVSWRREANLQAMRLVLTKEASDFTAAERQILAGYSGWGGLSIEKVQSQLPPELIPETLGLVHEYYTPPVIAKGLAETLCPLLAELAGADGVVHALEPSAGIGRLLGGFSPRLCLALEAGGQIKRIHWTAVEYSKVSSTLLRALRPDIDLYHMPFERWIREESARVRGTISVIVSNPPYGERGAMAREDPDEFYKEKRAYAYFMRRALDLLIPGGIGVFLVPAGFLSGSLNRGLREKLLLRNHLLGAFRLPSHDRKGRENVPGASVVMDMIFWRSRGGELTEVDEADRYIHEGDYFVQNKDHLLGVEDGSFSGEDEVGKTTSWRYKVTGELPTRLPPLAPRPVCTSCVLNVITPREAGIFHTVVRGDDGIPADVVGELRHALELGARVDRYLAALGADEADRVNALWPELNAALRDFAASFGNPARSAELRELAGKRGLQAAQQILNAFDRSGALISALGEPPRIEAKFAGLADDVVAQAELLFRTHRELSVKKLLEFHTKQGGTRSQEDALAALIKAEWNLDGDTWDELYPRDAYLTGYELWARHDRAKARAARGDEQARVQVRRLLDAIKPAVFEDITDIDPRHGYIDLALVSGWLSSTLNANYGRVELERVDGFVQIRGYDYIEADAPPVSPDVLTFLGYYNHDPEMFRPPQEKRDRDAAPMSKEERAAAKQSLGDRRVALAKKWAESFVQYVAADPERRESLANAYNRAARGRIVPTYSAEPLYIARWGAGAPKPRAHQIAGARRVLDLLGGLIAFDVGVGKTYTALMIIARARQEGVVRRPVILVPSSLVWKWHDDILCTLPDYRVLVIGSKRKRISRGERKGVMTSETDTPQERAQKWQLLQSGQADVVVLSYDALGRTKMNEAAVVRYVEEVEAVQRSIALRRRALEEQAKNEKAKAKLSERDRALLEHGVKAWIEEILALPSDWTYDPGIAWDDIGIDMLVVDEAAGFKNLHMPQAREDGVPKFMGGGGDGSDRAWQLDFRAAAIRRRTGGAGIVLLTATPAKNSPLEFYNLIQFIDPTAFTRAGIRDPEQFIDRFLKIEIREVLDSTFEITRRSAVTGFKNLEDLRTLIFRYGEFRTAEEVGLKLPRPVVETITIAMDEVQEAKYRHYVARIEEILSNPNPDSSPGNVILGLLARLSLIALHGALEDGYNYRTALNGGVVDRRRYNKKGEVEIVKVTLPRPQYSSPKLVECARRVAASPHCGHIIFCEPTAVHLWLIEVLVEHGIPRDRIAVMNAAETKSADRLRIAREFNGLSSEPPPPGTCGGASSTAITPKTDVIIGNSVMNEGLDLQTRTCSLHHLDLTWTPADLEQRNGRAVRQGNTLGIVRIYYYFAEGSTDGYRFSLIDGKAGWLGELIKSQVRDTNNPAAQQQLSPEDILLMISRDKDKTRAMLEDKRRRQAEEARKRIALEAARLYRQAAARFRAARVSDDAEVAARLREEGELRLADLERVDAEAWPWAPWMYAARDHEVLIPDTGAPVYEGLRIARPRAGAEQLDHLEFGRIVDTDEGVRIGLRAAGSPSWQLVNYTGLVNDAPLLPGHLARTGGPAWPEDDDTATAAALDKKIPEVFRFGRYASLRWRGASDAWLEKWWPRYEPALRDGLVKGDRDVVPVEGQKGLALASGDEIRDGKILLPTHAGWLRFLELAPASGEKFTALKEIGLEWWGRRVPQNLLSGGKDEPPNDDPPQTKPPRGEPPQAEAPSQATTLTAEQVAQMQSVLDEARAVEGTPEDLDRRVIENLALTHAAMNDALAFGGASKADRSKLVEDTRATAERITLLRAVAGILRQRGYEVALAGQTQNSFNIIGRDGQLLAAASHGKMARYAPSLAGDELRRIEHDLAEARQTTKDIILDEARTRGPNVSEEMMLAVWRRARGSTGEAQDSTPASAPEPTRYPPPAPAPENKYEDARSAIKALGLPPKKYAYYLRRAEEAIGEGKGWAPVVARARQAADKLSGAAKPPSRAVKQPEGRPAARTSAVELTLDRFNAEPLWRAQTVRPRANGFVLAVLPEGKDIDAAVVSLDVVSGEVDEVRWLDERLPQRDRDVILDRLERSLWDAFAEHDEAADDDADQPPSPLQDLIDLMERRSKALGARPTTTADLGRNDGYGPIAVALRDLARPTGPSVEELQRWLEAEDLMSAGDVVGRARGTEPMPVQQLMRDLWGGVFEVLTRDQVAGRPGALRLPVEAIFHDADKSGDFVLQRVHQGERHVLRRIRVRVGQPDADTDEVQIEDPSDRLASGDEVHRAERPEQFFIELYGKLGTFHDDLERAPRILQDIRTLLYWAAVMLDAPLCQGEVKARAAAAFTQAQAFHDTARRALIDGRSVDAVRRMQAALERISTAAAEIARSCAEGQLEIRATPPGLPVSPEDVNVMRESMAPVAPANALQGAGVPSMSAMAASVPDATRPAHPIVVTTRGAPPTPEQLHERFNAHRAFVHYIFRTKSGLPELLTREEIEAKARVAVGADLFDQALESPIPGDYFFMSCVGAVEKALDAKFEGRADPLWTASSRQIAEEKRALKEKQA